MKKLLISFVVVALLFILTACAPKLPEIDEAARIAKNHLDPVISVFQVNSYVIDAYSDGVPVQYFADDINFYLVENFDSLFDPEMLTDDQTLELKEAIGLRITASNGTFIMNESYEQFKDTLFTGEYSIVVNSVEDNQIFCTVTCEYLVEAESTETTSLNYPMVLRRYAREIIVEDEKTELEYYWRISQMFNPLDTESAIVAEPDPAVE